MTIGCCRRPYSGTHKALNSRPRLQPPGSNPNFNTHVAMQQPGGPPGMQPPDPGDLGPSGGPPGRRPQGGPGPGPRGWQLAQPHRQRPPRRAGYIWVPPMPETPKKLRRVPVGDWPDHLEGYGDLSGLKEEREQWQRQVHQMMIDAGELDGQMEDY